MTAPAPRPLLLAAAGHACVAWWHAGAQPGAALAVVLANSWGEEDVAAYDGQRALACRLAEAGLGVLRFEWPDTGDSAAATGATGVPEALAAFDAAADAARARSGCARLAFVGLRLGALLAAHAAVARRDVDALVALLPVASGKAFVREQRLLGAVGGRVGHEPEGTTLLGGFALPTARVGELSALKWPQTATAPVRDALVLERADLPCRPAAEALARMGIEVREWAHAELAQATAVAHHARLAPAAIEEIARWLGERAREPAPAPGGPVPVVAAADGWLRTEAGGIAVRERVALIDGPGAPTLAGVLAERDLPGAPPRGRRGVLLLSSGHERRGGPHRLWVAYARERAARGDAVLRLDIAGVGDSAARDGSAALDPQRHYDPRGVDDVARAIDWLRREHGAGPCVVAGLCSGAHHAWRAALAGVDVQQVVAINPLVFHWKPGHSLDPREQPFGQIAIAARARRALLDPRRWWKLLRGRANVRVIAGAFAARAGLALRLRARELARLVRWPLQDDLAAELAATCARGVALQFVFSSNEPGLPLLRAEAGRIGARLEREGRLEVCEVAHADHTFAAVAGRRGLHAALDMLLDRRWSAPAAQHERAGEALAKEAR